MTLYRYLVTWQIPRMPVEGETFSALDWSLKTYEIVLETVAPSAEDAVFHTQPEAYADMEKNRGGKAQSFGGTNHPHFSKIEITHEVNLPTLGVDK